MRILFLLTLLFSLSCCQQLVPPTDPPVNPPEGQRCRGRRCFLTTTRAPQIAPGVPTILITGGSSGSGRPETSISVKTLDANGAPQADLPDLPDCRSSHTLDERMLCGGTGCDKGDITTQTTCLHLIDNLSWKRYPWRMKAARYNHVSWKRPDGAIQLMGGYKSSGYTSEVVTPSGSVDGFRMKDYTLGGCSIQFDDYVIITGGIKDCNNVRVDCTNPRVDTVSKYNIEGWVEYLPSLNTARSGNGCGHYLNSNGEVVYLVTGGWNWNSNDRTGGRVSSTELLEATATSWTFAGNLPTARRDLVGISLNNRIFMTGGNADAGSLAEILEFDKDTEEWRILTAEMSGARTNHAVTVISE